MNIFDSAIIVAAIAGGITGALVAVVVSLGVIRAQRRQGAPSGEASRPSTAWRTPSGPLARHLGQADPAASAAQRDEAGRPPE